MSEEMKGGGWVNFGDGTDAAQCYSRVTHNKITVKLPDLIRKYNKIFNKSRIILSNFHLDKSLRHTLRHCYDVATIHRRNRIHYNYNI